MISLGLALQKRAHNHMAAVRIRTSQAPLTSRDNPEPESPKGKVPLTVFKLAGWWVGLFLVIGGEVGNFAAYGDPETPASVVTAVGCVGVIANAIIATAWLKEPFRKRDLVGVFFVVGGVILVVFFAPKQDTVLDAERFYWLLWQPWALALFVLFGIAICVLYFLIPRYGHRHVIWNLSMSSLIGSFTVMASKAVSTFVQLTIKGMADPLLPFADQIDSSYSELSCVEAGFHWGPLQLEAPFTDGCITVTPWCE